MQIIKEELRKDISIHNVVCTASLEQSVDISSFNKYENLSSDLARYQCGYVKDKTMIGRVTVFGNGKLISVGTKSPKQAEKELKIASKILQNYNLTKKAKIIPNVRNMIGRFDLKKKIDVEQLARIMPKSLYEPEQFAGLIFRIKGSLVALIFASGKGVLAGGKTYSEINEGLFEVERWIK